MQILKQYFSCLFIFITWCYCVKSSPLSSSNDSYPVPGTAIIHIVGPTIPSLSGSQNCVFNLQAAQIIFHVTKHENDEKHKGKNSSDVPSGYIVTSGIGAHKLYLNKKNWNDARKTCAREGAHLAVIDSYKEDEMFQKLRTQNKLESVWIGLHDLFQEGEWTTVLDQAIGTNGYVNWSEKFKPNPDNYKGRQHCARLAVGGMDDIECNATFAFICKISLD